MIAHQPENGVGAILTAGQRRVAWATRFLDFRHHHLRHQQRKLMVLVFLAALNLLAGELS